MREADFRTYLQTIGYNSGTINSRVSNCLRVCEFEGDLDEHFQKDKCNSLLEKLTYTTADERNFIPSKHSVPIDGNVRTGSATLKQAVKLYYKFCKNSNSFTSHSEKVYTVPIVRKNRALPTAHITTPSRDSYKEFFEYFKINKEDFYAFGIDNTIFSSFEYAKSQWKELKKALLENEILNIRSYGRQGKNTDLFLNMYQFIFKNTKIAMDKTNNLAPKRNIQLATNYHVNKTLYNYQCSHIFGQTKNPLLFEATWNICLSPKIFDPLTGHEAAGCWPQEYTALLNQFAYKKFYELIEDYNKFVVDMAIEDKINSYIYSIRTEYESKVIDKFGKDAISEWKQIKCI